MAETQTPIDPEQLLALAETRSRESRQELFDNVSELFIAEENRLSDRERALLRGILENLIADVEFAVRAALAERLSDMDAAPAELVEMVANDDIEVARPVLLRSRLLRDPQLIAIVRERGREHALAIAERDPLSAAVGDALVATEDADVIERLLDNPSAELSRAAMTYLVTEAERVDRFREPLVRRADLPPDLAMRLYWYVSAAWRRHILETHAISAHQLDPAMQAATRSAAESAGPSSGEAARELTRQLDTERQLTPELVVTLFRERRHLAAIGGLARLGRLDERVVRHILIDGGGEPLAVLARAAGFGRETFGRLYLVVRGLVRRGQGAGDLNEMLAYHDRVSEEQAEVVLTYWRRDPGYVEAIGTLDRALADQDGGPPGLAPST